MVVRKWTELVRRGTIDRLRTSLSKSVSQSLELPFFWLVWGVRTWACFAVIGLKQVWLCPLTFFQCLFVARYVKDPINDADEEEELCDSPKSVLPSTSLITCPSKDDFDFRSSNGRKFNFSERFYAFCVFLFEFFLHLAVIIGQMLHFEQILIWGVEYPFKFTTWLTFLSKTNSFVT